MEKRWYVIHTYSGHENKVKTNLEKRVESMGMGDKIFRVVVPTEETVEVKGGKRKTVQKRVFPGYVMVEMIMTDESWYLVRNTPGVTGFVGSTGSGSKPTPLKDHEVRAILRQMGEMEARPAVDFQVNEPVRVVEGPFADFVGTVDEVLVEKNKLRVMINMFGRETPVELDFDQVERLN